MSRFKYPRTFHLPWSPGATSDDKMMPSVDSFVGQEVVVTEKLDGENTNMYRDYIHARSVSSKHHPSRDWVKAFHASIAHEIPEGWRLCGENLFAKHSIHYTCLASYFYLFGIYDESNNCLPWDDTLEFAEILNVSIVPQLYRGLWDEDAVKACWTGETVLSCGTPNEQEGYVVRLASGFPYEQHHVAAGKYVRENHVQTSTHWMSEEIVPNILCDS